jgi:hypothetical protein
MPALKRRKRDWTSPLLITISLHLMVFTLAINQRLFSLMGQSRGSGENVLSMGTDLGQENEPEKDQGAAPGEAAPEIGQRPQSVAEAMKPTQTPKVHPREVETPPVPKEDGKTEQKQPDSRPLNERLDGSLETSGGATGAEGAVIVPGGGAHGLRGRGRHGKGLSKNGGDVGTENAVEMGLAWLSKVQDSDGRWDSDGFMTHYLAAPTEAERAAEGSGGTYKDLGVTALCLMAFTGAGYTEEDARYGNVVSRARKFLLGQQRPEDGGFGGKPGQSNQMYEHAIATLALADLYLTGGDAGLRAPLKRALLYLLSQQRDGGGWTYDQYLPSHAGTTFKVEQRNDLSISGWCILALVAGREAGFELPEDNMRRMVKFLKKATQSDGSGIYADIGTRAGERGLGMLAVSNVCRRLLGEKGDTYIQEQQQKKLADNSPDWSKVENRQDGSFYYWYYGSIALLLNKDEKGGADRWREWNVGLKGALLGNQCQSGPRRGSFDPMEFWADKGGGGRLYATAINILTLEVYYRLEPGYLKARADELADFWK